MAQELGPSTNLSAIVNVTVFVVDQNDNPPVFVETEYRVELPENMTAGTRVVQVHADDVDSGLGGRIRYTQILGYLNTSLNLDASSGVITVSTNNHGFDREKMPEYHLYVEARDDDGRGNRAEVKYDDGMCFFFFLYPFTFLLVRTYSGSSDNTINRCQR